MPTITTKGIGALNRILLTYALKIQLETCKGKTGN
jgi:hypothetical protein